MTSDLFNYFNGKYVDWTFRSSSAARARLKAWDQRHESQPSWEEDFYDYESSEQVWDEVTCGQSVMGVDDCGILPEEKWEYIKNPSLSTKEIWQLCADESASDLDESYDMDRYYSHREQYDMAYSDHYDWVDGIDPDYDYYDYYADYDEYHPCDYEWYESDHPSNIFFCHELEKESEKYIEDCKVWSKTVQEIAGFDECEMVDGVPHPPELKPEPRPLISDHHYRKAA
jgi:hypothetical protein